jgi:hypothetical protein
VLLHGRRLDLYRTFENLSVGSNVATHCWLLSLEAEFEKHGKLPDTLYHQVATTVIIYDLCSHRVCVCVCMCMFLG